MAINLTNLIKDQLSPELVTQVSTHLGETNSDVTKAISAFLPTVIAGLTNKSEDIGVFNSLKNLASSDFSMDTDEITTIIKTLLFSIFGEHTETLINRISQFSGISTESSHQVLDLVGGSSFSFLGKYISDNNLDYHQFSTLLKDQKAQITSVMPLGFDWSGLGISEVAPVILPKVDVEIPKETAILNKEIENTDTEEQIRKNIPVYPSSTEASGSSVFKWLLPLLLLLLAGWFLWKQCTVKKENTAVMLNNTTVEQDDATPEATSPQSVNEVRESFVLTLPSGKSINAIKGGIEDQVVQFLTSEEYKKATEGDLRDKWFNFDRLNFEFGTTFLTPESIVQLENLKTILQEFPNAHIKIGAYTDKKGDAAINLKLSKDRATAIKNTLATNQVKEAEGYGDQFAEVPAEATDAEREKDRKTAIRFVK